MIVRLQDNPHIIVKPETYPITVTGATYYNFIESGATTITKVQSGNLVDVTIYNPSGSSTTWGMIVGDINNQTDLTDYVSQSISAATSGLTSSWNGLTGYPTDNSDLNAIITGLTADIQTNYECCTGNTADINYHYQQFTGFTDYVYTLIVPAITGNTQDISDLNDSLTAHTSQVGSGSIHFTGHTFTQSGITVITQVGDNVNIYVPADAITGVTWGSITGTLSGQTDLWNVLAEKVDSQVYHDDLQTLSDTIDSNATGVTATFVTLTGTTLPATYLTLSDFNTFSGTTLPANYYTQTAADALLVDKVDWVLYQDDLQGIYEAISGITSGLTTTLSGCTDVTITSPADNDILKYSGGTWINETSVDLFTSVNDGDLLQRSGTTVVGIAISGLTITLQSAINTYTGTTAPASFLPITGLTGYWTSAQTENYVTGLGYLTGYTVTADDVTGITASLYAPIVHTHAYSAITDTPDLSVYQPVSGMSAYLTGVTWNDVTNKPDLTLQSDFTGHTSDLTIHYPQSGISITESQISDFGDYALESDFTGHTSDLTIHFVQSGISITESQISDLQAYTLTGTTQALSDAFDTYTGTTAPASFLPITGLTGYWNSGQTVDYVTGYTPTLEWGNITGTISGQTDLWGYISGTTGGEWGTITGDITGQTDLVIYVNTAISAATSGMTTSLSGLTDTTITTPADNDILKYSGTTWVNEAPVDIFANVAEGDLLIRSSSTISGVTQSKFALSAHTHSEYLTGFTVTCDMVTGCTDGLYLPITGLTGYWTSAQTTGYISGLGYLTGYTVTADDVTGITATLYSPTGHTHSTYVEKIATIVTLTASTILDSSYASKIVEVNSTGNTTITLYSGATIGTRIDIVNVNTGDVTLAAQGTLQSDGTKLATQYTGASVYARGTSTWLAVGKLTT